MISFVGSSHISRESVNAVKKALAGEEVDIVALELDASRAYSLRHQAKRPKSLSLIKSIGLFGFLFLVLGEMLQKHLGKIVDMDPGSEMITALSLAEKKNLKVALIDRDISITLRRLSRIPKREILRIVWDLLTGPLRKEKVRLDLSKVPDSKLIEAVLKHTKERYPHLYDTLVDERNSYMARKLFSIQRHFPEANILAVVGAGHLSGIKYYLRKLAESNLSISFK